MRARAIYDEWGTIALAWLVVGYIIIIVLSVLMEASRCAVGLSAFGADLPNDDGATSPARKDLKPPSSLREGKPRESFVGQNMTAML